MKEEKIEKDFHDYDYALNYYETVVVKNYYSMVKRRAEIIQRLPGKNVLDIGCGTGHLSAELLERGFIVSSLDVSEGMLRAARKLNKRTLRLVRGSAYKIPFKGESFDIVVFSAVLHHLLDIRRTLVAAFEVLKRGGYVVAFEWNKDFLSLGHLPFILATKTFGKFFGSHALDKPTKVKFHLLQTPHERPLRITWLKKAFIKEGFKLMEASSHRFFISCSFPLFKWYSFFAALDEILRHIPKIKYKGRSIIILAQKPTLI